MAMMGGIADPDYDYVHVVPELTPEQIQENKERHERLEAEFAAARKVLEDNPMKVDLGKKDVLFIEYFGKYYLINKYTDQLTGRLLLKHEIKYFAGLIFDGKGVISKSRPHLNTFVQNIVNEKGSVLLLKYVEDLTDLTPVEAQSLMKKHKDSVLRFTTHKAEFDTFVKSKQLNNSTVTVKKLREISGYGMMECKVALQHTDWDLDRAQDYLKGLKK